LQWAEFPINLPAALEDGLIEMFSPPWNKTGRKTSSGEPLYQTETEEAESILMKPIEANSDNEDAEINALKKKITKM